MIFDKKVFWSCPRHLVSISGELGYILVDSQVFAPPGLFLLPDLSRLLCFLHPLEFICFLLLQLVHLLNHILCNNITAFGRHFACLPHDQFISRDQPDAIERVFKKVNFEAHQVQVVNSLKVVANLVTHLETVVDWVFFAKLGVAGAKLLEVELDCPVEGVLRLGLTLSFLHRLEAGRNKLKSVVLP